MHWSLFWLFLVAFELPVIAISILCWEEGYFAPTSRQQLRRARAGKAFFLIQHGGIFWGDSLIVSPMMAFITARYGAVFNPLLLLGLLVAAGLVGIPLLEQWKKEGIETPSGLGRDGQMTTAGAVHYFYMSVAFVLVVLFFVTSGVRVRDIWIITALLMGHVALGILQPIYTTSGKIPQETWVIFASGWAALIFLGIVRTAFTY